MFLVVISYMLIYLHKESRRREKHYIIQIAYNNFTLAELKFSVIFLVHKQIQVEKYDNPN